MILKILKEGHKKLRMKAQPVEKRTPELAKFCFSLQKTLNASGGIGLAANQVADLRRIIALKFPTYQGVLINPEIIKKTEEKLPWNEGCLSVRGKVQTNHRSEGIIVRFREPGNFDEIVEKEFHGLDAVCVQHEIDHLNGILISDYKDKK